jgi:hypothetical protein
MCIVTGVRIDFVIALIDRMKKLFAGKGLVTLDTKETVVELNSVKTYITSDIIIIYYCC